MSEREIKAKAIESFDNLKRKVDNYDRYNYYLNVEGRKRPALIVMELTHTGNGYINGSYVKTNSCETTKAGDINIKKLSDDEIIRLIEEAIHYIKNKIVIK